MKILCLSLYTTHLTQTQTPTFTVICWTEMSWCCSSHIISTLMLAFSVLWMLIFSPHTHVFYTAPRLADDDALLLSISFTHLTPIFVFLSHSCESKPKLGLWVWVKFCSTIQCLQWTLEQSEWIWVKQTAGGSIQALLFQLLSHTSQHQVSFAPTLLVSAHLHWQYKQYSC
jgi:hypothetical protein